MVLQERQRKLHPWVPRPDGGRCAHARIPGALSKDVLLDRGEGRGLVAKAHAPTTNTWQGGINNTRTRQRGYCNASFRERHAKLIGVSTTSMLPERGELQNRWDGFPGRRHRQRRCGLRPVQCTVASLEQHAARSQGSQSTQDHCPPTTQHPKERNHPFRTHPERTATKPTAGPLPELRLGALVF